MHLLYFLLFALSCSALHTRLKASRIATRMGAEQSTASVATGGKGPVCLVVNVEIKEDRIDEFLKVIEADAVGSRNEPGCLRFDVLRSGTASFTFIEYYSDDDAVVYHKAQPHFALWTDFKTGGGVVSQTVFKADGLFMS